MKMFHHYHVVWPEQPIRDQNRFETLSKPVPTIEES